MALQTSGHISIKDIKTEFGGNTPARLSSYYRNGALVPNIPQNNKIPTSGAIRLSDFWGTQTFTPVFYELTFNGSLTIDGSDYFWFGYYNNGAVPQFKITHRNWSYGSGISVDWTLKQANYTDFAKPVTETGSYGALSQINAGTINSVSYNQDYTLPNIPKNTYLAYTTPNPTTGYSILSDQVMIELQNLTGRPSKTLDQTQSSSNNYTTKVLVNDDGYAAQSGASFTLIYRWIEIAP